MRNFRAPKRGGKRSTSLPGETFRLENLTELTTAEVQALFQGETPWAISIALYSPILIPNSSASHTHTLSYKSGATNSTNGLSFYLLWGPASRFYDWGSTLPSP